MSKTTNYSTNLLPSHITGPISNVNIYRNVIFSIVNISAVAKGTFTDWKKKPTQRWILKELSL